MAYSLATIPAPTSNTRGYILPQFEDQYNSAQVLADVLQYKFSINGEDYALGTDVDWLTNPSPDIEWHIELHKFYYAPSLARRYVETRDVRYKKCFVSLVRGWIKQTPPGFIAPEVTARRIQNWTYAWYLFHELGSDEFTAEFTEIFLDSLAEQVNLVCDNLAPTRNHRTLEIYAIFVAAIVFPVLGSADRWLQLAVDEMIKNIATDLLPDGVHCELSTDYHHLVLRSYLLFFKLAKLNRIELPAHASEKLCRALDFAMHIHRPDGYIPALSDSDSRSFLGLLNWGAELFDRGDYAYVASSGTMGAPPAQRHVCFEDGGYAVQRSPWQSNEPFCDARYLVFDCGPVGAGNHGHLDALSIEIAAYGKPLIVDPGRYSYDEQGEINWRARFRQTSAHNTITVDGCDQGIYKIRGRKRKIFDPKPKCTLTNFEYNQNICHLQGFVKSPSYDAVHHRCIWFVDDRYWVIVDQLFASECHRYELRYQLTPEAQGQLKWTRHAGATEIQSPGLTTMITREIVEVSGEQSFVSRQYGIKHSAPRICAHTSGANQGFLTLLYPTNGAHPNLHVTNATGTHHEITIADSERSDTWRWDYLKQSVAYATAASTQTWRLPSDSRNG